MKFGGISAVVNRLSFAIRVGKIRVGSVEILNGAYQHEDEGIRLPALD